MNVERTKNDDVLTLIAFGAFVVLSGGASVALDVLPAFRAWAIEAKLLVTGDAVLLPFSDGAGLDLPRLVLVLSVVLFVFSVFGFAVRHRLRQPERKKW